MALSKNPIKTSKKPKAVVKGGTGVVEKKENRLLSDEINEIIHNQTKAKKSIDPESLDYFGDAAKVTKSGEDFGQIEDDNRGSRIRGDIESEFTVGKYSGKKSSRKDKDMEEDQEEIDQDGDMFGLGGDDDQDEDESEDLEDAFEFQDNIDQQGSEDDEEDGSDDENIVVSSNIDRADLLFKKLQKQESEETNSPKLVGGNNSSEFDEMEKAHNTKNQTSLYNEFLTTRILLQKTINCANKLPKPKAYKEFIEFDNTLEDKYSETKNAACLLVSEIFNIQNQLMELNDDIPKSSNGTKKRIRPDQNLKEIWNIIEEQNSRLEQFHNSTITKWNNRISVTGAAGPSGGKNNNLKSLNQSILSQISNTLNDFERLQKRTKLKRNTYKIFGEKQSLQQQQLQQSIDQNEEERDEYDDEIFDDSDFYQNLLKDLESSTNDENEVGSQYWIEMRNLKKKKKKKVNQKASKGRILRYEVFPKIENFMTPESIAPCDWNIDQLYQNLFSGLGNNI